MKIAIPLIFGTLDESCDATVPPADGSPTTYDDVARNYDTVLVGCSVQQQCGWAGAPARSDAGPAAHFVRDSQVRVAAKTGVEVFGTARNTDLVVDSFHGLGDLTSRAVYVPG